MIMKHLNCRAHNWLAYRINDSFLRKTSFLYKGMIYDLGCGEATYRAYLLGYASHYVGVDWSGSFHNTKADIIADLNKPLPIDNQVADTLISISVLEHLCEPQIFLDESFRILKPGGSMILQVPFQWWIHEAPYDFFRYTPYGLKYLLVKAGFVDVVVEPQSGFFTMWILKLNYFSRRFIRGPKPLRWLIKTCLIPFWYSGQISAPLLDTLDRNWAAETSGYFVTAQKPTSP